MNHLERATLELWLEDLKSGKISSIPMADLKLLLPPVALHVMSSSVDDIVAAERAEHDARYAEWAKHLQTTPAVDEYLAGFRNLLERMKDAKEKKRKSRPSPREHRRSCNVGYVSGPQKLIKKVIEDAQSFGMIWECRLTDDDKRCLIHPTDMTDDNPKFLIKVDWPPSYSDLQVKLWIADRPEHHVEQFEDRTKELTIEFLECFLSGAFSTVATSSD